MAATLKKYIKERIISGAEEIDFEQGWDDALSGEVYSWFYMPQNKSANANENWADYKGDIQATMREIYMPTLNRINEYGGVPDFLENNTGGVADWRYWFNHYANCYAWTEGDGEDEMVEIRDRCVEAVYKTTFITLQAHIRRRQASIRVIKKLHLTGSLH